MMQHWRMCPPCNMWVRSHQLTSPERLAQSLRPVSVERWLPSCAYWSRTMIAMPLRPLLRCSESVGIRCAPRQTARAPLPSRQYSILRSVFWTFDMPLMTGHEVARFLRRQPWGRQMLIVALSGWRQGGDRALAGEAGFDYQLMKPAGIESLAELFETAHG